MKNARTILLIITTLLIFSSIADDQLLVEHNYLCEITTQSKTYAIGDKGHEEDPPNFMKLIRSYPDFIVGYDNNYILFKDSTKLLFDDHKKKSTLELLTNPDINDQFYYPYPAGELLTPPVAYDDPGRITNEDLFKKIYGSTKEDVEKSLVEIVWCPKLFRRKSKSNKHKWS